MAINAQNSLLCIRPKDLTTDFLDPIGDIFGDKYIIVDDNDEAHASALSRLQQLHPASIIIFLGHGSSTCLHSAKTESYKQRDFITKDNNDIFVNNNVLLLTCRSEQLISRFNGYKDIIGFGNIISSREEISQEAEETGKFRTLEDNEIETFNKSFVYAIRTSFELLLSEKIAFSQIPQYISFFINKCINNILRDQSFKNRIELARLLFEFRNEMKHLKGY
ncbi:hypothetical protein [Olivibacter oleidegradans]|uniref:CHAT domain-containing protein n=1 Tax=Olivibacter oleidegradans TaxID=760123 RepID=A0ABV6HFM2_9SPHI